MNKPEIYGNWIITYWAKPIPDRRHDWEATHKDYDGPGDMRAFTGASREDVIAQVDEYEADREERFQRKDRRDQMLQDVGLIKSE